MVRREGSKPDGRDAQLMTWGGSVHESLVPRMRDGPLMAYLNAARAFVGRLNGGGDGGKHAIFQQALGPRRAFPDVACPHCAQRINSGIAFKVKGSCSEV
jgi:hypothetical protein